MSTEVFSNKDFTNYLDKMRESAFQFQECKLNGYEIYDRLTVDLK